MTGNPLSCIMSLLSTEVNSLSSLGSFLLDALVMLGCLAVCWPHGSS